MSTVVSDLLDTSQRLQEQFEASTSLESRKRQGQFFTPGPICRFMAGLLSFSEGSYRLLDPGAGVGALTAAVCDRFCRFKTPSRLEIHLFENDRNAVDLLTENMRNCRLAVESAGHTMEYHIHAADFVDVAGREFNKTRALFQADGDLGRFDGVILNLPTSRLPRTLFTRS